MHDSMMIADVGGIVNVSGSRIATPFAPPRPGSTPISTPSRMPMSMNSRFFHDSATAKPCSRLPMSSNETPRRRTLPAAIQGLITQQTLDRTLRQRHEEPQLEH